MATTPLWSPPGSARLGPARPGSARLDPPRPGSARLDPARPGVPPPWTMDSPYRPMPHSSLQSEQPAGWGERPGPATGRLLRPLRGAQAASIGVRSPAAPLPARIRPRIPVPRWTPMMRPIPPTAVLRRRRGLACLRATRNGEDRVGAMRQGIPRHPFVAMSHPGPRRVRMASTARTGSALRCRADADGSQFVVTLHLIPLVKTMSVALAA